MLFKILSVQKTFLRCEVVDSLRNHYVCSVYAAQLMVPRRQGLIVNISSMGGLKYAYNVAYGVGKAAVSY